MSTQSVNASASPLAALKPSDRAIQLFTKAAMVVLAAILIVSALVTVFPFLWSALLSTRDRTEIFGSGISFAIGDSLAINYAKLQEIMPFWQAMFNSVYVAFLGTTISLLFCSMGGYAFAVYKFKGKNPSVRNACRLNGYSASTKLDPVLHDREVPGTTG